MKRTEWILTKKVAVLSMVLALALVLIACGNEAARDGTYDIADAPPDALTLDQMQHDPMSFTGQISVAGIVSAHDRFTFSLSGDAGAFVLPIDYRGNQALPQVGTAIIVAGEMSRNCCGLHLLSTHFEVAE